MSARSLTFTYTSHNNANRPNASCRCFRNHAHHSYDASRINNSESVVIHPNELRIRVLSADEMKSIQRQINHVWARVHRCTFSAHENLISHKIQFCIKEKRVFMHMALLEREKQLNY